MVHTAIRHAYTDVPDPGLSGSYSHPAPALRRIAWDRRNETTPRSLSERAVSRVNSLRWQELVHDVGYIWPQHLGEHKRVRYSAERALATSARDTARDQRWEETYVERCLAESGKSATTLDEARRSQVIQSLLNHMAAAPLD